MLAIVQAEDEDVGGYKVQLPSGRLGVITNPVKVCPIQLQSAPPTKLVPNRHTSASDLRYPWNES